MGSRRPPLDANGHGKTFNSQRMLGFSMLAGTIFLWVGSSLALQAIFERVHFERPIFVTLFNSAMSTSLLVPRFCWKSNIDSAEESVSVGSKKAKASVFDKKHKEMMMTTLRLSSTVGVLWLCAQWVFNMSLAHTSVATNTVLSSTSSVFTFVFSILICGEPFRWTSFCAAFFSFLGCMIVALQTPKNLAADAITNTSFGDALTLASAAMFAFVSVMLQKLAPREFDTGFFMGMNGLLALSAAPFLLTAADNLGVEPFEAPQGETLLFLTLNAILGSTFANYLYTSAILLLSPLVTTVCMSLTIPISAVADEMVLREHGFSSGWALGASVVCIGVVCAALDMDAPSAAGSSTDSATQEEELEALTESGKDSQAMYSQLNDSLR